MKRNSKIALAVVAVSAAVTVMACFPDVVFKGGETGGGGAGTQASSSASAGSTGGQTSTSSSSTASSSSSSTSTSSTGTGTGGAAPCAKPCDCDGDGDHDKSAACNHDGGDCNDHDPFVSSKVTAFAYDDAGPNQWDYNCSNGIEYEVAGVLQCPVAGISCDTTTVKWHGAVPTCGVMGQIGTCKGTLMFCQENITGAKVQGCH